MTNKKKKVNNNNNNKKSVSNKYVLLGIAVLIAIVGVVISYPYFVSSNANLESSSDRSNLLGDWHDIHGIGLFNTEGSSNYNDTSIYLATHKGLYNKNQNSSWVKIGSDSSDLMGFVINPQKEGVMYSSGHPINGGNLGFRMSADSGKTWQTISSVTDSPIDFHAMSISPVNNDILYGSPGGGYALFITHDQGKTWSILTSIPSQIVSIAANPLDENGVYIGTGSGMFYSNDQGKNWKKIESKVIGDSVVTGLGFNQNNELFAYVMPNTAEEGNNNQNGYIIKSDELGKNWTKTNGQIPDVKAAWKFALGQNGEMYTIVSQQTTENDIASSVYRSIDNGNSWILEGTNRENIL
ncbi:MAG: WD40/YVTN/BNR-like repeat-containing protein [Nitrososphaeraceae archaeon]